MGNNENTTGGTGLPTNNNVTPEGLYDAVSTYTTNGTNILEAIDRHFNNPQNAGQSYFTIPMTELQAWRGLLTQGVSLCQPIVEAMKQEGPTGEQSVTLEPATAGAQSG